MHPSDRFGVHFWDGSGLQTRVPNDGLDREPVSRHNVVADRVVILASRDDFNASVTMSHKLYQRPLGGLAFPGDRHSFVVLRAYNVFPPALAHRPHSMAVDGGRRRLVPFGTSLGLELRRLFHGFDVSLPLDPVAVVLDLVGIQFERDLLSLGRRSLLRAQLSHRLFHSSDHHVPFHRQNRAHLRRLLPRFVSRRRRR